MGKLTIDHLDPTVEERLKRLAASHGHSVEEEARRILSTVLEDNLPQPANAYDLLRRRFNSGNYADLELPTRVCVHDDNLSG